jgi:hypothetical protein
MTAGCFIVIVFVAGCWELFRQPRVAGAKVEESLKDVIEVAV